jgi:hypothetical protein
MRSETEAIHNAAIPTINHWPTSAAAVLLRKSLGSGTGTAAKRRVRMYVHSADNRFNCLFGVDT